MNQLDPSAMDKWHQMYAIVRQYPMLIQPGLLLQFKKLYTKRLFAENVLLFLLQYIGASIMTHHFASSILWLDTGTACAFIFLRGPSILPGIMLGNFAAYCMVRMNVGLAFGCAILIAMQAYILWWVCCRRISPTLIFYRFSIFVTFSIWAAILTAMVSFLMMLVWCSFFSATTSFYQCWLNGWLANLNAILVFSSAILTWDMFFPNSFTIKQCVNGLLTPGYILLVSLIFMLCISQTQWLTFSFALLISLIIIVISARHGWCQCMIALFLTGILLNFARFMSAPVFLTRDVLLTVFLLQVLLYLSALVGMGMVVIKEGKE